MALLTCSKCGLQKEESSGSNRCPMCGGKLVLPTEEVSEEIILDEQVSTNEMFVDKEIFRAKLFQIAAPAFEDEKYLDDVVENTEHYLKQITSNYPEDLFLHIKESSYGELRELIYHRNFRESARANAASKAAAEYLSALRNGSGESDGLGFSIITNNTVDAVTYIGLAAHEEKMHKARHELEATKKFEQQIANIKSSSSGAGNSLIEAIDHIVYEFSLLHNAYEFVKTNADFYTKPAKNDIGITFEGINLYELLRHATQSSSGFIGECSSLPDELRKKPLEWILPQLEQMGYITYLELIYREPKTKLGKRIFSDEISKGKYVSTGKYENAIKKELYWSAHPEERESEEKSAELRNAEQYAQAETNYNNGKYYDAAVGFGKLDGYRDSLQRSLSIWNERILSNSFDGMKLRCGVTADGKAYHTRGGTTTEAKVYQELSKFHGIKQVCALDQKENHWIALGMNGKLKTFFNHKYLGDEELWAPVKALEKSSMKITAVYPRRGSWHDSEYVVFLFEDGTVFFNGHLAPDIYKTVDLSHWQNIDRIVTGDFIIIGIRKDKSIVAAGKTKNINNVIKEWKNIVDVKVDGDLLIALTADGRVLAIGGDPNNYDEIHDWRNIKSIYIEHNTPVGINDSGTVLWGSSTHDKYDARFANIYARLVGQRGIVTIDYKRALKVDGTVYSSDIYENLSEWTDVVYLGSGDAIRANGTIIFGHDPLKVSSQKVFEHIDTLAAERTRAMNQNTTFGIDSNRTYSSKSGGCYIATAVYGSYDCPQVWTLRRFRDNTLAKTWYGRVFIRTYYAVSPTLVKWFGLTTWFQHLWKRKLDRIVADLNASGIESTPYIDRSW